MESALFMWVFKFPREVSLPSKLPLSSLAVSLSVQMINLALHKPSTFACIMDQELASVGGSV